MQALAADDLERVKAILAADADAAMEPFWDHHCVPPLCYAVRALCNVAILEELLKCGAQVDADDMKRRTAYALLLDAKAAGHVYDFDSAEALLLGAGAEPLPPPMPSFLAQPAWPAMWQSMPPALPLR
jgi:hypothetical protein